MEEGDVVVEKVELKGFKKWLYEFLMIDVYVDNLEWRLSHAERQRKYKQKTIDELENTLKELRNTNHELVENKFNGHNDNVAVDFLNQQMIIFSVERRWSEDAKHPQTVVGYANNDGKLHEWFFNVSEDKHKALVLEFQSTLATKRMKGK
jgi:hypothetical protein